MPQEARGSGVFRRAAFTAIIAARFCDSLFASLLVPQKIWINGILVPPEQAVVNVYDHGLLYGDGVFEGIRCYGGRVLKLQTHLRRLYDSAKSIRLTIPYSQQQIADAMRETVQACERGDAYFRLVVTRGIGGLGLNPMTCAKPTVFIICDSISLYPEAMYQQGMAVVTASTMRTHPAALSPRIKSLNYLNNILAKIEAIDAGVSEAIMLNHLGYVAEATADNVFIVREQGHPGGKATLITTPLHAGCLEGVTRGIVLELAQKAGIPVDTPELTKHDLYTADEMFLTGSGAEIVPVTKIDGRPVGSGVPGAMTLRLLGLFRALVAHNAPED
jgi:branched-chain amino acid aminotransferase